MKISKTIEQFKTGQTNPVEYTHKVFDELEKINKEFYYFNTLCKEKALIQAEKIKKTKTGKLLGIPLSVKDAICVKDVETTAGSKILKGYLPTFNATCVNNAIKEGAIIVGKTSQDAFGFGSFNTNVGIGFKIPKNPFCKERCCGGSSGGSSGISQKTTLCHSSLGESTGGSIVAPASFCGVYGLCPTYSRVSRYGLLDYGSSLDKIGPISKHIEDVATVLEVISGFDKKDSTSSNTPVEKYSDSLKKGTKGIKIGVIKNLFGNDTNPQVTNTNWEYIKKLENAGIPYEEIELDLPINYGVQSYYLTSTCEASTNLAKFCGMRYGYTEKIEGSFNEFFSKVRSTAFGEEAKRRIMLGTFARMTGFRDAYYIKALKIRTKIINEYKSFFKKFDALICPTLPILPPKFEEIDKLTPLQCYMLDISTAGPNFAGLPHMNVPIKLVNNLPVGALLISNHFEESKLLQIGNIIKNKS